LLLNELIAKTGGEVVLRTKSEGALEIVGITADSRLVRPGFLFAALPGSKTDGRKFITAALAAGASGILQSEDITSGVPGGVALLTAANPRRALALLAAGLMPQQPATIAAVTGTSGKTSTAVFTRQLWSLLGARAASLGTIGVIAPDYVSAESLTTPDPVALHGILETLAMRGVDHLAIEASSHGLDQHRLDGVRLAAAAFTNLSHDHLDYHADMNAYRAAKLRLFSELLPSGGAAIVNADCAEAAMLSAIAQNRRQSLITFGAKGRDIRLAAQQPMARGQVLKIEVFGRLHEIEFPVNGLFQAQNLLAALGLVIGTGADPEKTVAMIGRLKGVTGRIEHVATTPNGASVYVDYAHKPAGLEAVLAALRPHAERRLVVVFGCGGDRDRAKRPQMGAIAARLADSVIVTDDNPRTEEPATIRKEILAAAPGALEIGDRAQAIKTAIGGLGAGDLLVIAGKGHETYQIVGTHKLPFDDAAVARAAVATLKGDAA